MSLHLPVRLLGVALAGSAVVALAACGAPVDEPSSSGSASASSSASASPACDPASLKTKTAGTLTIATGKPAYPPWVDDDNPRAARATRRPSPTPSPSSSATPTPRSTWIRTAFDAVIAPGPKNFDFNIQQFSINDERKKAVDFSSRLLRRHPGRRHLQGQPDRRARRPSPTSRTPSSAPPSAPPRSTPIEDAASRRRQQAQVFNNNDAAVTALKNKQIDGLVVDLPTAFYLAAAQIDNGVIVGQLPDTAGTAEQLGLLLAKGSPLTACVTQAVDALRADGTLAKLEDAVAAPRPAHPS